MWADGVVLSISVEANSEVIFAVIYPNYDSFPIEAC